MANARESTPREALEEFIELFREDGGEFIELESAVLQLSPHNRRLVSDFGALEFVNRFPQLFRQSRREVLLVLTAAPYPGLSLQVIKCMKRYSLKKLWGKGSFQ